MNLDKLSKQLERHEALKLMPYQDTEGYWTIGIGHCIDTNPLTPEQQIRIFGKELPPKEQLEALQRTGIDVAEAYRLLADDIEITYTACCMAYPGWFLALSDPRQNVVLNMVFNLGINNVKKFKLTMSAIRDGKYENASKEMLCSMWAKQVGYRANELSKQMLTNEYV